MVWSQQLSERTEPPSPLLLLYSPSKNGKNGKQVKQTDYISSKMGADP